MYIRLLKILVDNYSRYIIVVILIFCIELLYMIVDCVPAGELMKTKQISFSVLFAAHCCVKLIISIHRKYYLITFSWVMFIIMYCRWEFEFLIYWHFFILYSSKLILLLNGSCVDRTFYIIFVQIHWPSDWLYFHYLLYFDYVFFSFLFV